ncbi:RidA family protein [Spiroplasma melliferum]|uniref:Endoribonuclease L-PSP n=2 Tax=Spiroplasma melliferum TaxID=2134 RepID=A0AAI9X195_SPIME|nr:RidA family protein [Spiroplasma melliferum]ELL44853.1 putative endoribonuclease [Spiroplasma melliferum IPMB4A]KAI92710.1 endoribonuclease L-PSP [Spiroplasma melliferum KC3]QCO24323.1 putative endoribonuclease L-PSP [Spiroplasma melliferum]
MSKKIISTHLAPKAIGPYSQAVKIGNFLYVSGQLPLDPTTMMIEGTTITEQAKCALENLKAIVQSAGYSLTDVIKVNIFLKDINDFPAMNEVYQKYFTENFPARSAVAVANLPKNALVEIEAIGCLREEN